MKDGGDLFVDGVGLVAQFKTGVVAVKTFAKQGNDFCFVKGYFFSAEFNVFCFHLKKGLVYRSINGGFGGLLWGWGNFLLLKREHKEVKQKKLLLA